MQCWLPAVSLFVCLLSQPWRQGHGGAVSPSARWRPPSPKSAVAARSSSSSFDSSHSLSAGPTYTITSPPTHLRFTEHAQPGQGDGTAWGTGEAQERGGMGEKRGGEGGNYFINFFLESIFHAASRPLVPPQMADTIDINFQSDLMAIFEENLFWEEGTRAGPRRLTRSRFADRFQTPVLWRTRSLLTQMHTSAYTDSVLTVPFSQQLKQLVCVVNERWGEVKLKWQAPLLFVCFLFLFVPPFPGLVSLVVGSWSPWPTGPNGCPPPHMRIWWKGGDWASIFKEKKKKQ